MRVSFQALVGLKSTRVKSSDDRIEAVSEPTSLRRLAPAELPSALASWLTSSLLQRHITASYFTCTSLASHVHFAVLHTLRYVAKLSMCHIATVIRQYLSYAQSRDYHRPVPIDLQVW